MNRREFIGAIGAAAFAAVANTPAVESLSVAATGMQKRAIPSQRSPDVMKWNPGMFIAPRSRY